jgi:hypothetical protein
VCSVDKSYVSSASGYYDGSDRLDDISLRIGLPPAVVSCVLLSRSSWTNRTLNSAKSSNSAGPGSPGQLVKRKDFLVDDEAQNHPTGGGAAFVVDFVSRFQFADELFKPTAAIALFRTYYYRKNADVDEVINTCSKKLQVCQQNKL